MTISPLFGLRPLLTMTISSGRIPASIMESPDTFRRKDAVLSFMSISSREMVSASSSSAGLGKPASTDPRSLAA